MALRRIVTAAALAVGVWTPVALAEPAEEQYDFELPNAGGAGSSSGSGGSSAGTGFGTPGALGDAGDSTASGSAVSKILNTGGASHDSDGGDPSDRGVVPIIADTASGGDPSDRGIVPIIADTASDGAMPLLFATLLGITAAGAFIVLRRRRRKGAVGDDA